MISLNINLDYNDSLRILFLMSLLGIVKTAKILGQGMTQSGFQKLNKGPETKLNQDSNLLKPPSQQLEISTFYN